MRLVSVTGAAASLLFFGAIIPAYAQHEAPGEKEKQGKAAAPQARQEKSAPQSHAQQPKQAAPQQHAQQKQPQQHAQAQPHATQQARQQPHAQQPKTQPQQHAQQKQAPQPHAKPQPHPVQQARQPSRQPAQHAQQKQAPQPHAQPPAHQTQQARQQPAAARVQQTAHVQQPVRTQQQARSWQQQKGWQQGGGWQAHSSWQQDRAQNWSSDHRTWAQRGGYGGYYIPQAQFDVSFGVEHVFRLRRQPVIYMGYPRFEYGGFSFLMVDPWPEYFAADWYSSDDVYIDYDAGYYLCNRRYPQARLAITIQL